MEPKIKKATLDDVYQLAPHLRVADKQEIEVRGKTAEGGLLFSYLFTDEVYTFKYNKTIICMFGISTYNLPKGYGMIWCLGSDDIKQHVKAFLKRSSEFINQSLLKYDILFNEVDARNKAHIRYLKHFGFKFSGKTKYNNQDFIHFYKIKE